LVPDAGLAAPATSSPLARVAATTMMSVSHVILLARKIKSSVKLAVTAIWPRGKPAPPVVLILLGNRLVAFAGQPTSLGC
jgi:hypothetical protein